MLVIRYRRVGKRNHAQFKIVVAEKSFSVKGKFIETLGSHDPHSKETILKEDRIRHWIGVGAQCSDSVHNLLVSRGLIKSKKRKVNVPKPAESEENGEKKDVVDENKKESSVKEEQPVEEKGEEKEEVKEEKRVDFSNNEEKVAKQGAEPEDKKEDKKQ